MIVSISDLVKINQPNNGGSSQPSQPSKKEIEERPLDEPEKTDGEPESGEAPNKEGDDTVQTIDDIDSIDGGNPIIRRKQGTKTGEVISPEEGKRIAESEGVDVEKSKSPDDWKKRGRDSLPVQDKLTKRTKNAGSGMGNIYQRIMDLTEPIVDWRSELAHYVGRLSDKQQLRLGNRKSADKSNFRPGYRDSDNMLKNGVIATDVSGSVANSFPEFAAEIVGICMARRIRTVSVLPFANDVHDEFQIKNGARPTPEDFEKVRTGGGTEAIGDVINWIEDNIGSNPDFVVIITDGYLTNSLPEAPHWGRNTIWLVFDNPGFDVDEDWGTIIHAIGDPGYWQSV